MLRYRDVRITSGVLTICYEQESGFVTCLFILMCISLYAHNVALSLLEQCELI